MRGRPDRRMGAGLALAVVLLWGACGDDGPGAECGDGVINQGSEECDGDDFGGVSCEDIGFAGGSLACRTGCTVDLDGCVPGGCGDGVRGGSEECDGDDLGNATCLSLGYGGGTLSCGASCRLDTSGCSASVCGDGAAGDGEACDGDDLRGVTCLDLAYVAGTLRCRIDCQGYDESGCLYSYCGDGILYPSTEVCDGADLDGLDCSDFGFNGGTLACNSDCSDFDLSACTDPGVCGDGVANTPDELCDGLDVRGASCTMYGYTGGEITCTGTCDGFVLSRCLGGACGDGVFDHGEACDGAELDGATCQTLGFTSGTLGCGATCEAFDVSGCTGVGCGDGVVNGFEECDGADLGGEDCLSIGLGPGILRCYTEQCRFDIVGCGPPPAWTCELWRYGNVNGCDCGCGAPDPDCDDTLASSCDVCNGAGSCDQSGQGCPGNIDPDDNTRCF